jgi:hypothetical protein
MYLLFVKEPAFSWTEEISKLILLKAKFETIPKNKESMILQPAAFVFLEKDYEKYIYMFKYKKTAFFIYL